MSPRSKEQAVTKHRGAVRHLRPTLAGVSAFALCCGLGAGPARAQSDSEPSQNAMTNLIRLLVKQKVITQKNGDDLISEATREAAQARASKIATVPIPQQRPEPPPPAAGVLRVPYVPDIVKNQIRDEVKADVIKEAKEENWAQPEMLPAWTRKIKWTGDIRFRDEFDFYGRNNIGSNGEGFVNYSAFNANGPTDVNPNGLLFDIPFLNTTQDRYDQLSIRARVGLIADVGDGVTVGFRLGTGQNNSPVSTTQLLGGGFDKNDIWLDQLYITLQPVPYGSITFGRMPNPFLHTDLLYDDNLNFDGVALSGQSKPDGKPGLGGFGTLGAFPVGYIDPNFPDFSPTKAHDRTEWLLGGQAGIDWTRPRFDWQSAVSIYEYLNAQGQLSAPCPIYLGTKQCSTDDSVPPFMQKGNTLFLIRNIIADPSNPNDYAQPQFAGLAFNYKELNGTTRFDLKLSSNYQLILDADYVRNLDYAPNIALRYASLAVPVFPVTNYYNNQLQSGPNAYMGRVTIGDSFPPRALWQWSIVTGYKYVQPDATLDAFTDHDFYMGGTNDKGYFVKASLGIFDGTYLSARWFSANQVYGAPLAIDVLQLELNAVY
jgi:hypothetical protein